MTQFTKFLFYFVAIAKPLASGSPDFRTVETVAGLQIVRDHLNSSIRYYFPDDLRLGESVEGKPAVTVLETRYRGSAVNGDAGKELFSSLLRLSVQVPQPSASALAEVQKRFGARTELRPLPLERITLAVIHLPINERGPTKVPHTLPAAFEDGADSNVGNQTVWAERHETVRLDPQSAQLLADSWRHGRLLLSIGYTIDGAGIAPEAPLAKLEGAPEVLAELKRLTTSSDPSAKAISEKTPVLVKTGAIGVSIDSARWPDTWKRYDLNEGAPPGYPLLEARCYDFSNPEATPLYEKHLVIEADSVAGPKVTSVIRFQRDNPNISAQLVRFRVGVRLDRPYRYQVEAISEDGMSSKSPWNTNSMWSQLINISDNPGVKSFFKQP
jgi:hypothetical protein